MQILAKYIAACAAVLALAAACGAPAGAGPAALVGVWEAHQTVPQLAGTLTLDAARATLGGVAALGTADGTTRVYRFADRRGALRTARVGGERVAFWIQPPTWSGTVYATPVALVRGTDGVFRGTVAALPDRLQMSLYVTHGPGDEVDSFLRDPLFNIGRALKTMTVTQNGTAVQFAGQGPALTAHLRGPDTLTLEFPPDSKVPPLDFVRRTTAPAPVYPGYHVPAAQADGWRTAAADSAGIDVHALEDLTSFAAGGVPNGVQAPGVHSVLIARHGTLVFERYFAGFDAMTLHDTRSAGKTYADVLAGAAIQAGVRLSGDTPLLPLFKRYGQTARPDARKAHITLAHALSMSTGLDCDDNDDSSVANEERMQNQTTQPDWYRLVLDGRMVRDPGVTATYCSASINLAGGAIAAASGMWLPALFAHDVAEPLQMRRYALNLTPLGDWYLGGGAYVRPRDFLKIGQLFLDGGTWHGRRVLSREWIARSWDARVALGPDDGYGYAWHVRSYTIGKAAYRAYEAQGNGGQILDVLPQLDLAVMITQGNYNNFATWGPMRDALVTRIVAATHGP